MRPLRTLAIAAIVIVLLAMAARPAHADATLFLGANTTPSNGPVKGYAVGIGLLIVGFEFEYAATSNDVAALAPSLKTNMGNVVLQSPLPILGFQPYFTTGAGIYREELGAHEDTGVGMNVGGGVKMSLIGPLRLRLDYRVFKLGSGPLNSPAYRIYVGLNLSF